MSALTKKRKRAKSAAVEDEKEPAGLVDAVFFQPSCYPVVPMTVCNIVCTCRLGQPINLILTCLILRGKLDQAVFPASVCASRSPKATNSLFESGELVIAGAATVEVACLSAHRVAHKLRTVTGVFFRPFNFRVVNIVCTAVLGFKLNLDLFYCDHQDSCTRPEDFVGISWDVRGMMFVIFASGKVVVAGLKYNWQQARAQEELRVFHRYRLGHEYRVLEPERHRVVVPSVEHKAKRANGLLRERKVKRQKMTVSEYIEAIALEGCEDY